MKKLMKIFVLLGLLVVMAMAHAVKFNDHPNLKCKLTPEQLSDPDIVIEQGLKHAFKTFNTECKNLDIQQDNYRIFNVYHPTVAINTLENKYGHKRDPMTEVESGYFRDFKIIGKTAAKPVDGLEVLEYTVEILYVLLELYHHVPGHIRGYLPICEKNIVKINVIKTERGWYMESRYDIGQNFDQTQKNFRNTKNSLYHKDPVFYEKNIELQEKLIKRCKLTLN